MSIIKNGQVIAGNYNPSRDNKANLDLSNINEDGIKVIQENAITVAGLSLYDVITKDHVLGFTESLGFAPLGTYVYKNAVSGSRYGYETFYNKCLNSKLNGTPRVESLNNSDVTLYYGSDSRVYYDIADKDIIDLYYENTGSAYLFGVDEENSRIFLPRRNSRRLVEKKEATATDSTWYNLYSDGWVEQGGKLVVNSASVGGGTYSTAVLTFPKSFTKFISYKCQAKHDRFNAGFTVTLSAQALSSVTVYQVNDSSASYVNPYVVWEACGYTEVTTSLYDYMVVGNTANEEALTDIIDITTTENDTLPLFHNTYSKQDMTKTGAFVNASLGNYLEGSYWKTAYAEIEKMGIGAKFDAGTIKAYGDSTITDYDLVLNQDNMTFRLPLLNGDRVLVEATSTFKLYNDGWCWQRGSAVAPSTANTWGTTITLNRPYTSNGYTIYLTNHGNTSTAGALKFKDETKASGSFEVCSTVQSTAFLWITEGYTEVPTNTGVNLYYKLDNIVQNAQLLDVAGVTSALNNKVSVDNLVETPVVIETYNIGGSNGYIIWSNGWCEQWGRGQAPSTANTWGTTITLNKKYWNKAYGITLTNWGGSTQAAALKWNSDNLTESTFQVLASVQDTSFNWHTWGVLAEGEY